MKTVIVVTSAYGPEVVKLLGGQAELIKMIHESGADGVEIRHELLDPEHSELELLRAMVKKYQLTTVYSSPSALFNEQGQLNITELGWRMDEAVMLGATYLKMSLGHYLSGMELHSLTEKLQKYPVRLLIENDQTKTGGILTSLSAFFSQVNEHALNIGMAFDMANWDWLDEDAFESAKQLGKYVDYIHVKACTKSDGKTKAVAIDKTASDWKALLALLPEHVPLGIEFPLAGANLNRVTQHYVQILKEV